MTVLQNVTDSLQNATTVLLQNATQVYYKMRQVFRYKCDSFITKFNSYYKMRRLLQNCNSTYIDFDYFYIEYLYTYTYTTYTLITYTSYITCIYN